jgi:hypothetical protein
MIVSQASLLSVGDVETIVAPGQIVRDSSVRAGAAGEPTRECRRGR